MSYLLAVVGLIAICGTVWSIRHGLEVIKSRVSADPYSPSSLSTSPTRDRSRQC